MDGDAADPLLLGQRVVTILETGLRTATYKLATVSGCSAASTLAYSDRKSSCWPSSCLSISVSKVS